MNEVEAVSVFLDASAAFEGVAFPKDRPDSINYPLGRRAAAQVIQRAIDEAAAAERAKVVAWLRGGAGTDTTQLPRSTRALFLRGLHGYADAIEQGAHHDPE